MLLLYYVWRLSYVLVLYIAPDERLLDIQIKHNELNGEKNIGKHVKIIKHT